MGNKLAMRDPQPPPQQYAPGYLQGGASPTTNYATYESVTDGEYTISIDGVAYDVTGVDFTGVTNMDEVAAVIQAASRAATGGTEQVLWDSNDSIFYIISGSTLSTSAVSKASAVSGGTGTDISGAGTAYMDCDAGATGEVVFAAALKQINLAAVEINTYQTLNKQFPVAHAGQISVKMRHYPTAAFQALTMQVQVSDDGMATAEASSQWYTIGAQDNPGGDPAQLAQEPHEYAETSAGTSQENWVPYQFPVVAQKARIRVKCDARLGRVGADVGLVPLV